jgi:hypothetical protein
MSFKYSSFISYRRNPGDEIFVKKFKALIQSEGQNATNISKVFFDELSIAWGADFGKTIYEGILTSYFFIPIYHRTYLHVDNIWCAKEIYHAVEVEKKIRESINKEYCFILPVIYRGTAAALPTCLENKNAKDISRLLHLIISNKTNAGLEAFKQSLYVVFEKNMQLLNGIDLDLKSIDESIERPSDDEIKKWIDEQKKIQRTQESENLPILMKNE